MLVVGVTADGAGACYLRTADSVQQAHDIAMANCRRTYGGVCYLCSYGNGPDVLVQQWAQQEQARGQPRQQAGGGGGIAIGLGETLDVMTRVLGVATGVAAVRRGRTGGGGVGAMGGAARPAFNAPPLVGQGQGGNLEDCQRVDMQAGRQGLAQQCAGQGAGMGLLRPAV